MFYDHMKLHRSSDHIVISMRHVPFHPLSVFYFQLRIIPASRRHSPMCVAGLDARIMVLSKLLQKSEISPLMFHPPLGWNGRASASVLVEYTATAYRHQARYNQQPPTVLCFSTHSDLFLQK